MSQKNRSSESSVLKTVAYLFLFVVFLGVAAVVVLAYLPPEKRPVQLPFDVPFGVKPPPVQAADTGDAVAPVSTADFSTAQYRLLDGLPMPVKQQRRFMVAVHHNLALVGEKNNARLYTFEEGQWSETQTLFPNDNAPDVEAVALADNLAVVEANERLFVFNKPGSHWRFLTVIVPDAQTPDQEIGAPVVTSKQIFVPVEAKNAVFVFEVQKGGQEDVWKKTQELRAPEATDQAFGFALAAREDLAAISVLCRMENDHCSGAVELYERDGSGNWLKTETFVSPGTELDTLFGWSLALEKDTVFVGAPCERGTGPCQGAVYPFKKIGDSWTRLTELNGASPAEGARFGAELAAADNGLAVGYGKKNAVELFAFINTAWMHQTTLAPSFEEESDDDDTVGVTDFVAMGNAGLFLGTHVQSGDAEAAAFRRLDGWCVGGMFGCDAKSDAQPPAANTAEEATAIVSENPYQPLRLSCNGVGATACATAYCKESKSKKCRPENVLQQLAAEAYLISGGCPAENLEKNANTYGCRSATDTDEDTCRPFVMPLAAGAFLEKEKEEVLLAINDVCHRVHVEGWSYGYVMRFENGEYVRQRNLSFAQRRYPDSVDAADIFPELDGDAVAVLGSMVNAQGRNEMVYCLSGENQGIADWECMDSTWEEDGVSFLLWDNFGAESDKRKRQGCTFVGAKEKNLDGDSFVDLEVRLECTRGVPLNKKKTARKAETYTLEILFDGTRFRLKEELPEPLAYRKSQIE